MGDDETAALPPGTPLSTYFRDMAGRLGTSVTHELGTLDAVTIGRYAHAIGASDRVHFDTTAARRAGYDDVVAPPNLLAAIYEWGVGSAGDDLNLDGTPRANRADGLRAMGAGEEMEFCYPATAGMAVVCDETLEGVVAKSTRGGPCVFVTTAHTYRTSDGTVLNRNRRTVVRRNPVDDVR